MSDNIDWYNKAVGLLARREHSQRELKQKLKQRGAAANDIETVLTNLLDRGYQSDARFAASYVRSRVQSGYGPRRIQGEMAQRGISSALVAQVLDQDEEFWQKQLMEVWQRRFHGKLPKNQQEYGRQVRFLLQRGFATGHIQALIKLKK